MEVSFDQFARHAVQAEATLSAADADHIQSRPIGKMDVDVTLTAPDDDKPLVSSALQWAWVPTDRLSDNA
jgi:hypothetical protein